MLTSYLGFPWRSGENSAGGRSSLSLPRSPLPVAYLLAKQKRRFSCLLRGWTREPGCFPRLFGRLTDRADPDCFYLLLFLPLTLKYRLILDLTGGGCAFSRLSAP